MLQKARLISSIAVLYAVTIGVFCLIVVVSHSFEQQVAALSRPAVSLPKQPTIPDITLGKPLRVAVPTIGIDLPLDDGVYDNQTQSWTLSDTHAQYAVMSKPANDRSGTTFVYGHGTNAVFGKLSATHPPNGTIAQIYTDNGYIFTYSLVDIHDYTPTDTSLFDRIESGPPQLVIQTCTGVFSEWRTMFTFQFEKVSS